MQKTPQKGEGNRNPNSDVWESRTIAQSWCREDVKFKQQQNYSKKVQLSDGVLVLTPLDESCIPALRSGFAGYPVDPRWTAVKFHAWKIGRQWHQAYSQGTMVVRSTDSLLVPVEEAEATPEVSEQTQHSSAQKWYQRMPLSFSSQNRDQSREFTILMGKASVF